jgi:septal ring-binding cell division protein DamX
MKTILILALIAILLIFALRSFLDEEAEMPNQNESDEDLEDEDDG